VKLGKNEGGMLFDTDLCRMSGGWSGGYVKYRGVVFDGGHGPNPAPADNATMYFRSIPAPAGARRRFRRSAPLPTGPGAAKVPFGPLPHEWAKYRGLYLHGDNVILTYTVGTAGVMEMPAREGDLLTRTLNIVAGGAGASVVLADGTEGSSAVVADGVGVASNDSLNHDSRVVVAVIGAPQGASIVANGPRLSLKLPSLTQGTKIKIAYAKANANDMAAASESVKKAGAPIDLAQFKTGGPAHWTETVKTQGALGADDQPYTLDTITIPFENPYKSWMRIGGMDLFKDGKSAAISTWSGDVWIVTGIDAKLENLQWKRYATGLFRPSAEDRRRQDLRPRPRPDHPPS
jgi:hypothetical protein